MNAFDRSFGRKEAVRKSAELLRDFRAAFFPLDVFKMLSAFGRQISLCTYDGLESLPAAKAAISGVNPQMISRDGFCCLLPDTLFRFGKNFVEGPAWFLYYIDSIRESRIRFTLMHELGHIVLGHHRKMDTNILFGLDKLPEYRALDHQADLFSINMLAPAPAVYRFLKEHGFSWVPRQFAAFAARIVCSPCRTGAFPMAARNTFAESMTGIAVYAEIRPFSFRLACFRNIRRRRPLPN